MSVDKQELQLISGLGNTTTYDTVYKGVEAGLAELDNYDPSTEESANSKMNWQDYLKIGGAVGSSFLASKNTGSAATPAVQQNNIPWVPIAAGAGGLILVAMLMKNKK